MEDFSRIQDDSFPLRVESRPYSVAAHIFPDIKLELNMRSEVTPLRPSEFGRSWGQVKGFTEKNREDEMAGSCNLLVLGTDRRTVEDVKYKARDYLGRRRVEK